MTCRQRKFLTEELTVRPLLLTAPPLTLRVHVGTKRSCADRGKEKLIVTRDLGAAVAIDGPTHRRAGDSAARFQRHERVPIRGRAEPVDVYALPLAAA